MGSPAATRTSFASIHVVEERVQRRFDYVEAKAFDYVEADAKAVRRRRPAEKSKFVFNILSLLKKKIKKVLFQISPHASS
jgi:hypothetical protein